MQQQQEFLVAGEVNPDDMQPLVQPVVKKIIQPIIIGRKVDLSNAPLPPTEVMETRELFRQKVLPPSTFQKKMIKFSDKESILRLQQVTNRTLETTPDMSSYKMWLQDSLGQNYQAGFRLEKNASKTLDSYVLYCSELFGNMNQLQPEDSLFLYFTDNPRVIRFEVKQSDKPRIVGMKQKRQEVVEEVVYVQEDQSLDWQMNSIFKREDAGNISVNTPSNTMEVKSEEGSAGHPYINQWVFMMGMMACVNHCMKKRKLGDFQQFKEFRVEAPSAIRPKKINISPDQVKMLRAVVSSTNEALAASRKAMATSGAALQRSNCLLQELFKSSGE